MLRTTADSSSTHPLLQYIIRFPRENHAGVAVVLHLTLLGKLFMKRKKTTVTPAAAAAVIVVDALPRKGNNLKERNKMLPNNLHFSKEYCFVVLYLQNDGA